MSFPEDLPHPAGGGRRPTNFSAHGLVAALQILVDRHAVPVTVEGFRPSREFRKFGTPVAELQIERLELEQSGTLRSLDGVFSASLLIMMRLDDDETEEAAFELALDVATALVDELEPGDVPVLQASAIRVTGIEPDAPEGALANRVAAYSVLFEFDLRVSRLDHIAEPATLRRLYAGKAPQIGLGHDGDYALIASADGATYQPGSGASTTVPSTGPIGSSSSASTNPGGLVGQNEITLLSAGPTSGGVCVRQIDELHAGLASADVVADAYAVIGVTVTATSAADQPIVVARTGDVVAGSWSFTPGLRVFCGPGGVLTQAHSDGWSYALVVGMAISATRMQVDIKTPIFQG